MKVFFVARQSRLGENASCLKWVSGFQKPILGCSTRRQIKKLQGVLGRTVQQLFYVVDTVMRLKWVSGAAYLKVEMRPRRPSRISHPTNHRTLFHLLTNSDIHF